MILIDHFITDYVDAMREDASAINSTVRALKQYGELPKGQNQRLEIGINDIAKAIIASSVPNLTGRALVDKASQLFKLKRFNLPALTEKTPENIVQLHYQTPVTMVADILIGLWTYDPSNERTEARRKKMRHASMVVNHTQTSVSFERVGFKDDMTIDRQQEALFTLQNTPLSGQPAPKENLTRLHLYHLELMGNARGRPYWEIFGSNA